MPIASVNPATGETLRTFEEPTDAEIANRLTAAAHGFQTWKRTALTQRIAMLRRTADILDAERGQFGQLMTLEMGKTHKSAQEEAAKCAIGCRYYADHVEEMLVPEIIVKAGREVGFVAYQPLGAILAIMPWNFPFWQVVRFAAPALVAGNVALLKHASNVPQCALALEDLFRRAGCPPGVFQTLLIGANRVPALIADERVAGVTLTGSEPAGREVASIAGRQLKKTVLELGGSDPFIVLGSADVARAASVAVTARTINNGQSCIAAKRFIVVDSVADEFERRLVEGMRALRVGDPMNPDTELGPLATPKIAEELEAQVRASVERGARVLTGGSRVRGAGNYFEPTVITDIPRDAPAYGEELFGPVAQLFRVPNADRALALANDTRFGLGASVWTRDSAESDRFAEEIESGQVFINSMVASDPRFPFGGIKHSGYGRELGPYGLLEFVNVKTVRIEAGASAARATE
jgi:succinate-semialdehyde dehydrogenase/glutarate-semialdehyde dehydrogenase